MAQETQTGLCINLEEWDGEGDGGRFKKEGIYIYLWLIHVDVWQKPTQYCEAIILQLKIIKLEKNPATAGSEDKEIIALGAAAFAFWRRQWHPTTVLLPGESQGWGRTESATTEVT